MPVVGFMCKYKGAVSFEECLECAKTWEQPCEFREPMIKMMADDLREERKGISVTMITGCLRKAYLAATTEYRVGIEEEWWRFRGRLGHSILEAYKGYDAEIDCPICLGSRYVGGQAQACSHCKASGKIAAVIKEKRFGMMYVHKGKEYPISGRVDLVIRPKKLLDDWKTAATVPRYKYPYSGHTKQMNIYRRILIKNEIPIDRMEVVYMDMKQPKPLDCQIWPDAAVDKFLEKTLVVLSEAFETGIAPQKPKNDDEGLWQCGGYCEEILKMKCAELGEAELLARLKVEECAKCKVKLAREKASPIAGKVIGVNTGVVGSTTEIPVGDKVDCDVVSDGHGGLMDQYGSIQE